MAKKSLIARDEKRLRTIERYARTRAELKENSVNVNLSDEERAKAITRLQKLPRNASPIRLQRRCRQCGRPHAVYRKFALCRICLRQTLMAGHVPGGRKSSW